MKSEKAFVGGTIVEVHCKVLPEKLFASPSTHAVPVPQPSPESEVLYNYICVLCLKTLWVFEFYFTVCGFSLYLCWLSLGLSGTEALCVCSTLTLSKCRTSQRRGETLTPGALPCGATWGGSLTFVSLPSLVWPLLFLALVTMHF